MQLVFWLPNSDVGLTPVAWVPKLSMVLCPFWIRSVQLTHLPNQEFIQGSEGSAIQLDPLPSKRPGDSTKKALFASLPNPSFILQPHQQDSYFHSSCDLNCSRIMQLVMSDTSTQTDYSPGSVHKSSSKQQLQTVK